MIEENAKATIVVAMTARGSSSPMLSAMLFAMRWKKGCRDHMRQGGKNEEAKYYNDTHHHLDHHAPISAREPTGARSVDELGYYRP